MIKVKVDDAKVMASLNQIIRLSGDLRPVLLQILGQPGDKNPMTIIGGINKSFVTQSGNNNTGPWRPLNREYAKRKNKKYPGKSMLIATSRLYKSYMGLGNENVKILTTRNLTWGTVVPYAGYHQSDKPRTRLPRRPTLDVNNKQLKMWNVLLTAYITEAKSIGGQQ